MWRRGAQLLRSGRRGLPAAISVASGSRQGRLGVGMGMMVVGSAAFAALAAVPADGAAHMAATVEDEENPEEDSPAPELTVRLRRANTNLTSFDSMLMGYEYRLRETASFEKIFKYFASVVHDDELYMTPLDLVRAISPGVPPSPNSKPLNIPLFENSKTELNFSKQELPDFFKFGPDDSGLISYQRFLVVVTLLSLPRKEVPVAYRMCAGEFFKNEKLRSSGLNVHNFDFIMQRNIKIGGQGYTTDHSPDDIVHYLFGPGLKKTLSLEEFQKFHLELRDEVQKLQYYLLSDKLDQNDQPLMSLLAFAKSVAALVPSDYRGELLERARGLSQEIVPEAVSKKEGGALSTEIFVSFEEYVIWREILRSLVQMETAIMQYSYADGHFSRTNINRAAIAVTGHALTRPQIWAIFKMFDPEDENELHHDQFVRLLKPHSINIDPRSEDEGLGLGSLFECLGSKCSQCVRNWYEGTDD